MRRPRTSEQWSRRDGRSGRPGGAGRRKDRADRLAATRYPIITTGIPGSADRHFGERRGRYWRQQRRARVPPVGAVCDGRHNRTHANRFCRGVTRVARSSSIRFLCPRSPARLDAADVAIVWRRTSTTDTDQSARCARIVRDTGPSPAWSAVWPALWLSDCGWVTSEGTHELTG